MMRIKKAAEIITPPYMNSVSGQPVAAEVGCYRGSNELEEKARALIPKGL